MFSKVYCGLKLLFILICAVYNSVYLIGQRELYLKMKYFASELLYYLSPVFRVCA